MKELAEVEKLDLVAREEAVKGFLHRARIPLIILTAFFVLLAFVSGASFYEILAVRVLAMLAVVTTVLVWFDSRYAIYALAVACFAVLIGGWLPFDDPDSHTLPGATIKYVISAMALFAGYRWWANGLPFIEAHSKELEKELHQVRVWIDELRGNEQTDRVVEFSTGNFWTGYWTFRVLRTENFWVTGRFKKGNIRQLRDCRVLESNAVQVAVEAGGKLRVEIGGRSISGIDLSNDVRERLLHLVKRN